MKPKSGSLILVTFGSFGIALAGGLTNCLCCWTVAGGDLLTPGRDPKDGGPCCLVPADDTDPDVSSASDESFDLWVKELIKSSLSM
jgi:hypothetical protein